MAATSWLKSTALERLRATPQKFDYAQAIRLLEQAHHYNHKLSSDILSFPPLTLVGSKALPHQERLRLRPTVTLSFSATDLTKWSCKEPEQGLRQEIIDVSFLGLVGSSGALPVHFTEMILERMHSGDYALKEFLDIFHHRILSFFYRASIKHKILLSFEAKTHEKRQSDLNTTIFQSLHGNRLKEANPFIASNAGVFYAGLFAQKPRSALGLTRLLSSYLSLPVSIDQFKGSWLVLDPKDWSRLSSRRQETFHNKLGRGALLGRKIWSVDHKFTIAIGPLSFAKFNQFLPGRGYLASVNYLINYYINSNLNDEINLILKAKEIPFCQLGKHSPPQLGWNTWLIRQKPANDRADTFLKKDHFL